MWRKWKVLDDFPETKFLPSLWRTATDILLQNLRTASGGTGGGFLSIVSCTIGIFFANVATDEAGSNTYYLLRLCYYWCGRVSCNDASALSGALPGNNRCNETWDDVIKKGGKQEFVAFILLSMCAFKSSALRGERIGAEFASVLSVFCALIPDLG